MFTHKITNTYQTDAGPVSTVLSTYTGDTEDGFDGSVPATTVDHPVNINCVKLNIQSLMLTSNVAVSIKTNSTTAPTQTIPLAAGQQLNWGHDFPNPCPITADITGGLFISNATTGPATVKIRILSLP